jgi:phenylacetate-CoA ligase
VKQLESLYPRLPLPLQDAAVSLQGWLYRRQRYGTAFREEHAFLTSTEFASPLQLDLIQVARLKRILGWAAASIPFYRERLSALPVDSLRPGSLDAFYRFPLTEKESVRRRPAEFLPDGKVPAGSIPWNTSGTTGSPMRFYYTQEAVSRQYAFVERYREQAGVSRRSRRAQFTGKLIAAEDSPARCWRYDWANNCLLLSTVHLSEHNIPSYLKAIRRFGAEYITGYPSAIALLASAVLQRPELGFPLKAVLTSAETLLDEQRLTIGSAFSSRVYDQYGQTEMQSFWFECRYGRMHAHPLFGLTEILRPNGDPCSPGETGDVVLTGFLNTAMPLIRYRVGDRAAWSEEISCPCGRHLPIIASIEGRQDDYIFSPDRGLVGRMDPVLKGVEGIVECQFVQEVPLRLDVRYVPSPALTAADLARLRKNLRERLGPSMELRFEECPRIPRGANGKFRSVISRLPKDFRASLHAEEIAS